MRVLGVLGALCLLLGVTLASIFGWGSVVRWAIADDWSHGGLVGALLLLGLALYSLYEREKEEDDLELKGLRASIDTFGAKVLPSYPFSDAHVFRDVLEIRLRFVLLNNANSQISPRVTRVNLFHKPGKRWKELPVSLDGCSSYSLEEYRVPPRSSGYGSFQVRTCLPGGASAYGGRLLRVEIVMAIPGQRPNPVVKVFRLDPATPSAGPEPSTASGQGPPSSPGSSGA
jgi:hypothetical protein